MFTWWAQGAVQSCVDQSHTNAYQPRTRWSRTKGPIGVLLLSNDVCQIGSVPVELDWYHQPGSQDPESNFGKEMTLEAPMGEVVSGEKNPEVPVAIFVGATWFGQRCAEAGMLDQGQTGLRVRSELDVVETSRRNHGRCPSTDPIFDHAREWLRTHTLSESKHEDHLSRGVPTADICQKLDNVDIAPRFFP